jgi:hypothetical protein
MKTLLQNEMGQISGGHRCYSAYKCYYKINSLGNFTTGEPIGYSATPCPPMQLGSTVNKPAMADAFSKDPKNIKKAYKIYISVPDLIHSEATVTIGSDICVE